MRNQRQILLSDITVKFQSTLDKEKNIKNSKKYIKNSFMETIGV